MKSFWYIVTCGKLFHVHVFVTCYFVFKMCKRVSTFSHCLIEKLRFFFEKPNTTFSNLPSHAWPSLTKLSFNLYFSTTNYFLKKYKMFQVPLQSWLVFFINSIFFLLCFSACFRSMLLENQWLRSKWKSKSSKSFESRDNLSSLCHGVK